MEKQTVDAVINLTSEIKTLKSIKSALENIPPVNHDQGVAPFFATTIIGGCLRELAAITSVAPVVQHLQCLVDATLTEKQTALDNL